MSDHDDSSNTFDPLLRPLMDYWTAYSRQLNEAAEAVSQRASSSEEDQTQGREWLDAASESIDAYLRSPLFLGLLKNHLDTLIALKQQSNALGEMAAATGGLSSDTRGASEIVRCLGHLESTLADRLSRLEQRFDAVERKLDALGGPP